MSLLHLSVRLFPVLKREALSTIYQGLIRQRSAINTDWPSHTGNFVKYGRTDSIGSQKRGTHVFSRVFILGCGCETSS